MKHTYIHTKPAVCNVTAILSSTQNISLLFASHFSTIFDSIGDRWHYNKRV
jgi:hypothetical protein